MGSRAPERRIARELHEPTLAHARYTAECNVWLDGQQQQRDERAAEWCCTQQTSLFFHELIIMPHSVVWSRNFGFCASAHCMWWAGRWLTFCSLSLSLRLSDFTLVIPIATALRSCPSSAMVIVAAAAAVCTCYVFIFISQFMRILLLCKWLHLSADSSFLTENSLISFICCFLSMQRSRDVCFARPPSLYRRQAHCCRLLPFVHQLSHALFIFGCEIKRLVWLAAARCCLSLASASNLYNGSTPLK